MSAVYELFQLTDDGRGRIGASAYSSGPATLTAQLMNLERALRENPSHRYEVAAATPIYELYALTAEGVRKPSASSRGPMPLIDALDALRTALEEVDARGYHVLRYEIAAVDA